MKENKQELTCRIYCEATDFDLTIPDISEDLLTAMFLNETCIKTPRGVFDVSDKFINWTLDIPECRKVFEKLNESLSIKLEDVVKLYFFMILFQDPYAKDVFVDTVYLTKGAFQNAFKDYNDRYLETPEANKTRICPDMLFCLLIYTLMHTRQQAEFEIPSDVLPYIVNIAGISAEEAEKAFNKDLPYEKDVIDPNEGKLKKPNIIQRIFGKRY